MSELKVPAWLRILAHLSRYKGDDPCPGQTYHGIGEILGIPYPSVVHQCVTLRDAGYIREDGRLIVGKVPTSRERAAYVVTDEGRALLDRTLHDLFRAKDASARIMAEAEREMGVA